MLRRALVAVLAGALLASGITTAAHARSNPFGHVDAVGRNADGSLWVGGWALDRDRGTRSTQVHFYIGSRFVGWADANEHRSDLASAFPQYGGNHAYHVARLDVGPQAGTLTVYAINYDGDQPSGPHPVMGSRSFPAAGSPGAEAETFSQFPVGSWAEGSTQGSWYVNYDGYGRVGVDQLSTGNKVLAMQPTVNPPSTGTSAAEVTSVSPTHGDVTIDARVRTTSQNRNERTPPQTPNAWEVAWLLWNHSVRPGPGNQGTGIPVTETEHCYYIVLKPTGWELGKVDQAKFTADDEGGQRYLATGTDRRFPVGRWYDLRVEQVGATITVTVDGRQLVEFTDGPGSGGLKPWAAHPDQEVYTSGSVGLYVEDARAEFDDVRVRAV